jgi:crotonobetaine/carnitine-CoA ligase
VKMPLREEAVLPYVIERFASSTPSRPCVVDMESGSWTWSEAAAEMHVAAQVLRSLGVERGELVGLMLGNGLGWLRAWWGLSRMGAIPVMINPAYRGSILRHVCVESKIERIITNEELYLRTEEVGLELELITPERLCVASDTDVDLGAAVEPWDIAGIIFTSGTTGPSKGALVTHMQLHVASPAEWCPTPDDVFYVQGPLFHMSGLAASISAWQSGASVALHQRFHGSTFLSDIRNSGATSALLIGTMASVLSASEELPDDRDNPLRNVVMIPLVPDPNEFMRRFGIGKLHVMYGMSELPRVLGWEWTKVEQRESAGKQLPGYEIRLVDDNDVDVPEGDIGELIVRSSRPWTISNGYLNRPEESAEAWRNGWFHTRDLFRRDPEGFYYFIDRATDSLRRRGENISSFEVEREVLAFPGVSEAACIGVHAEYGDQEVKVFIVPAAGAIIEPEALIEFLDPRLPYFMIPRYVQLVSELPKTPSTKVKKFELRSMGLGTDTWDAKARLSSP